MKKELFRSLFLPLFAALLGFSAFLRMPGSENVRNVQIVALLASGMGLGIALAHVRIILGLKSRE